MTNFAVKHLYTHLGGFVQSTLLASALAALTACASFDAGLRTRESSLPIQIRGTTGGIIDGERAFETEDKLMIAGRLKQSHGRSIPAPAHVDVFLLTTNGTVIAEGRDNIDSSHPRLSRARQGQIPFVVSFPLAVAREADSIRIIYDPKSHASNFATTTQQ